MIDGGCGGEFKLYIEERLSLVQESLEEEKPPNIVRPSTSYSRSQPEDFLSVLTAFPDLGLDLLIMLSKYTLNIGNQAIIIQ